MTGISTAFVREHVLSESYEDPATGRARDHEDAQAEATWRVNVDTLREPGGLLGKPPTHPPDRMCPCETVRKGLAPFPDATKDASFAADPSRIRHVERLGERIHVGVDRCPQTVQRERGSPPARAWDRVRHRSRCSGAFPDRVGVSTTGGAAQDGAHTPSVRDLAFPGSLRPRRQSWPDGQRPFVAFDQLRRSNFPGTRAAPSNAVRSASGKDSLWKEEHGTR
jgi:hypothetical protein